MDLLGSTDQFLTVTFSFYFPPRSHFDLLIPCCVFLFLVTILNQAGCFVHVIHAQAKDLATVDSLAPITNTASETIIVIQSLSITLMPLLNIRAKQNLRGRLSQPTHTDIIDAQMGGPEALQMSDKWTPDRQRTAYSNLMDS